MKIIWKKVTKDFKTKLRLSFMLLLTISMLVIGGVTYQKAKEAISEQIMGSAMNSVNILDSIITTLIKPKIENTEWFAEHVEQLANDPVELQEAFDQYVQLHPDVNSLSYGTEDGRFFRSPNIDLGKDFNHKNREWYIQAMDNKQQTIITPPYASAGTGDLVLSIAHADSKGQGVFTIGINLISLQEKAQSVKIGQEGYMVLLDETERFIYHPMYKGGEPPSENENFWDELYKEATGRFSYMYQQEDASLDKEMFFTTNELTGWKIAGTLFDAEVDKAVQPISRSTIIIISVVLVLSIVVVYFIIMSIVKPIRRMQKQAEKVSQGDLTQPIDVTTIDEIGALGNALNEMQTSLRTLISNVDASSRKVAYTSDELKESASQTSKASEQVAVAITEIAEGAEKQVLSLEKNSQALEEIYTGVTRIAERTTTVSELSARTSTQAQEGGDAVDQTLAQMKSIFSSVQQSNETIGGLHIRANEIGEISNAINNLANQTNLLALNASIEAARAGEHGKGFTVVASEVRKLAEQSSVASAHIRELIDEVQRDAEYSVQTMAKVTSEVEDGLRITDSTRNKFQIILGSMEQTEPIIDELAAIMQQIAASVESVATSAKDLSLLATGHGATSEEVAASSQEQLASMEEITASSEALSTMAADLQQLISRFKTE